MKTNKLTACLAALALTLGTAALTYAAAPGYNAPVQAFDDYEIAGWTDPITTARFCIKVVDAETGEPLAGVRIGNWVSDGTGAAFEGTYELYDGTFRFEVGEVPDGYLLPDKVNYGSGHYQVFDLEDVNITFRIPRAPAPTEPTEPATDPMREDAPVYVYHRYAVLDKTGSTLYLIRIPVTAADWEFADNGSWLQTYILSGNGVFAETVEQAEPGDILEYKDGDLGYTEMSCWNYFVRSEEDRGYFEEAGNLLTDEAYADNIIEWHGEKHLAFTSKEGNRYVVFTSDYAYPSFYPESCLNDFGDLNHDGLRNASDAALILKQAAMFGAHGDATFLDPRMVEAKIIGDLNGDGFSNASDAALMLIYAAYFGAQREAPADLQSYLYELNDTVKRVTIDYRSGLSSDHVTKELITSSAEFETFFTETVTPYNINTTDCLVRRDGAEVLTELMAAYPEEFFETHNLAVFCTYEANHNNRQEIRQIETSDGAVTITMHHLDIFGQPVEGCYAVLVAVDKSITDVSRITVNETHSSYMG